VRPLRVFPMLCKSKVTANIQIECWCAVSYRGRLLHKSSLQTCRLISTWWHARAALWTTPMHVQHNFNHSVGLNKTSESTPIHSAYIPSLHVIDTDCTVCGRVYVTVRCPSICLSHLWPLQQHVAGLLLGTLVVGNINQLCTCSRCGVQQVSSVKAARHTAVQQSVAKASSDTILFTAGIRGWTQTCTVSCMFSRTEY